MYGSAFADRRDAGRQLAKALAHHAGEKGLLVLALPRGGVPVGYEVAKALGADLDILLVRKLGTPGQPELAMGAIASGGIEVINPRIVQALGISERQIQEVAREEYAELQRREAAYRGDRPFPEIAGRTVILVDDGLATGASMKAAIQALKTQASLRSRERFWDIRVPKIDSILDNSLVPRPSWSPGVPPQHRKLVAATHRSPI